MSITCYQFRPSTRLLTDTMTPISSYAGWRRFIVDPLNQLEIDNFEDFTAVTFADISETLSNSFKQAPIPALQFQKFVSGLVEHAGVISNSALIADAQAALQRMLPQASSAAEVEVSRKRQRHDSDDEAESARRPAASSQEQQVGMAAELEKRNVAAVDGGTAGAGSALHPTVTQPEPELEEEEEEEYPCVCLYCDAEFMGPFDGDDKTCELCHGTQKRILEHVLASKQDGTCYLCDEARVLCPGCTRGFIQYRHEELFMGCGVLIRCPLCVGYGGALRDVEVLKANYLNEDHSVADRQYAEMERDIRKKYPDFEWPNA